MKYGDLFHQSISVVSRFFQLYISQDADHEFGGLVAALEKFLKEDSVSEKDALFMVIFFSQAARMDRDELKKTYFALGAEFFLFDPVDDLYECVNVIGSSYDTR